MPDYVDVVRLDVRANRVPTVSVPSLVTLHEGQNTLFDVSINTGYPRATSLTFSLRNANNNPVSQGGSNPTITAIDTLSEVDGDNVQAGLTHRVNAPTLPGDSPVYVDWLVTFTITSSEGSDTATTRIRVYQSVAATLSFPENVSAYEQTDFSSSDLMYNAGSPVATEIRHSFHNSLADARSGANPRTSGRPSVSISPTSQALANLAGQSIRVRNGTLNYGSALPAVSGDTRWYGRLEIVQNGSVVDSTAYTLTILNAVTPSLVITSGFAIEGTRAITPITYTAGAPYADRFSIVGFYNSQSDAQNNRNRLTSADGIPSAIQWAPATPSEATGTQHGFLYYTLPYVSADKRLWGLARIERDREDGQQGVDYWQTTFYVDVLNRVPAEIDVQEIITMDEESTMMVMFTYTRGVPAARGFGVSIHESQSDADNNRNAVMDTDDPRITLSDYDNTGSQTAQKTGTATIVTPDIGNRDRSWYPRFYMDADVIPPDPS
ncbi:MAG: hypothetical protein OXH00_02700 [Candidatus Poribacteria bacterium]|nr:hypothetical protein [Candidatus Poribacteria bacterium]